MINTNTATSALPIYRQQSGSKHQSKWQLLLLTGLGSLLLFWHLDFKYLWQDEAQTAVLAERMLQYGRPLAYDGKNLLTIDHFVAEDASPNRERTSHADAAVQYYIRRGDIKPDTSWRWHPWGQFIVGAMSLAAFGKNTFAARLPFAIAGLLTLIVTYRFVLRDLHNITMAFITALLLAFNVYWILHCRQCRYYSLSSLLLVLTISSYFRWQQGEDWGAFAFVLTAWCWFQVDYGMLWPVLFVLFCDALWTHRDDPWPTIIVGTFLSATLFPFVRYFGLLHRVSSPARPWAARFILNFLNVNQYVVPTTILIAVAILVRYKWRDLPSDERRIIVVAFSIIGAFVLWVPLATPASFLRYAIIAAPVGCFLSAWVLVRALATPAPGLMWAGTALLILTPWATWLIPTPGWYRSATVLRPELAILRKEIFLHLNDPNRIMISWLKQNATPSDEILISDADAPLMFYLPNPIRGGVSAFRAEDDTVRPPDFLILRRSVKHVHWDIFDREMQRYHWSEVPLHVPEAWGNNPDPLAVAQDESSTTYTFVARRVH